MAVTRDASALCGRTTHERGNFPIVIAASQHPWRDVPGIYLNSGKALMIVVQTPHASGMPTKNQNDSTKP